MRITKPILPFLAVACLAAAASQPATGPATKPTDWNETIRASLTALEKSNRQVAPLTATTAQRKEVDAKKEQARKDAVQALLARPAGSVTFTVDDVVAPKPSDASQVYAITGHFDVPAPMVAAGDKRQPARITLITPDASVKGFKVGDRKTISGAALKAASFSEFQNPAKRTVNGGTITDTAGNIYLTPFLTFEVKTPA